MDYRERSLLHKKKPVGGTAYLKESDYWIKNPITEIRSELRKYESDYENKNPITGYSNIMPRSVAYSVIYQVKAYRPLSRNTVAYVNKGRFY